MDSCTCPPGCCSGNRWFKPAVIILGILIVLGLFGNIYLLLRKEKQTPAISKITPTLTQVAILATPTPNPTANWKTYTDSTYKFSFKYPSDWKLSCLTTELPENWLDRIICDIRSPNVILDHGQVSNGSYFTVGVSKPNINYANFSEYLNYSSKEFGYTFGDKQINNIFGKIALKEGKETNYLFERNGHFIDANWIYSESSESVDQILSTFKFLD